MTLSRTFLGSSICALMVAASIPAAQPQPRTVYISAFDKQGAAASMQPTDIQITEDGRARQVLTVAPAPPPARVALVINDHGLGLAEVREGLSLLIRDAPASTAIGIFSADRAEWTVVDFTTDRSRATDGVATLVPTTAGASDFDRLVSNLARRLLRDSSRTAVLTIGVDQPSPQVGVLAATRDRGAQPSPAVKPMLPTNLGTSVLFANPVTLGHVRQSGAVYFGVVARHRRPDDHDGLIEAAAEASGGSVTTVMVDPQVPALIERSLVNILDQLAVTYSSAPAPKDGARLRVKVTRPDVTVRAPERVF